MKVDMKLLGLAKNDAHYRDIKVEEFQNWKVPSNMPQCGNEGVRSRDFKP